MTNFHLDSVEYWPSFTMIGIKRFTRDENEKQNPRRSRVYTNVTATSLKRMGTLLAGPTYRLIGLTGSRYIRNHGWPTCPTPPSAPPTKPYS